MSDKGAGAAVSLRSVSKTFGGRQAVVDMTLAVDRGVCFGLLGPNGAGKSTTLKMIYGFLRPDSGTIAVDGVDVSRHPRRARALLGIAPQEDLLDPELDVLQNLLFHARYHRMPARHAGEACLAALGAMGLEDYAGAPISQLSTGMRRRLVLARALLNDPRIVILDEPTRGLDRQSRRQHLDTLAGLKGRGATLVLATHDLAEAEALCDRAAIMERGRILREGPPAEILAAYRALEPAGAEETC